LSNSVAASPGAGESVAGSLRVLFIDRDGTIIEEPPDEQVDSVQKLRLLPGVIPALLQLVEAGYRLVLVSNQDGLGTELFPRESFRGAQDFLRELLASQGIRFDAEFFCPHFPADDCACRKPKTGLLDDYLRRHKIDSGHSYVIGDRETDLQLAVNLGLKGIRIAGKRGDGELWVEVAQRLSSQHRGPQRSVAASANRQDPHKMGSNSSAPHRTSHVERKTKETDISVDVDLDAEVPISISTGLGFFDHMLEQIARHGGFSLQMNCGGDLHVDEHHTVEDCALALGQALKTALGDKRGIGRYGFLLAMDEALAQVAIDISGRPFFVFEGHFNREQVGQLPTELVPHFFRSLAESLGAAIHLSVKGENTHHMVEACFKGVGRALRQAIRVEGKELPSSKGVL
jgi:imidazoleglycerol-phosphate dehydratase/histidinol-phosphatase